MDAPTVSDRHPALTDDQTGLPNRRHFDTVFKTLFAMARRGMPLTVLVLEIEGVDELDQEGGAADEGRVFRSVAKTLEPMIRQTDLLARLDESRVVVGLVDCNLAGAAVVAHRIDGYLDMMRGETGLKFCLGGASFEGTFDRADDLLDAAEKALDVARGRTSNRVAFFSETTRNGGE
jgi:diguanylate cyclase (GGDEF)-like protein